MLLGIAITHDLRHRDENDIDASGLSVFEERTSRIIKNLPYIAIVGALIAAVASMKIFAGSEVSIFTLENRNTARNLTNRIRFMQGFTNDFWIVFIRLVRGEHVVIGGDDGDIVTQHAFQRGFVFWLAGSETVCQVTSGVSVIKAHRCWLATMVCAAPALRSS